MKFSIKINYAHLKVLSSILTDIASGLILLLVGIRNIDVLLITILMACSCLIIAVKIEEILER